MCIFNFSIVIRTSFVAVFRPCLIFTFIFEPSFLGFNFPHPFSSAHRPSPFAFVFLSSRPSTSQTTLDREDKQQIALLLFFSFCVFLFFSQVLCIRRPNPARSVVTCFTARLPHFSQHPRCDVTVSHLIDFAVFLHLRARAPHRSFVSKTD